MVLTKSQKDKIEQFAISHYKKLDQTHGIEHLKRTLKLAKYLAREEKANQEIVKLGAILHQLHNPENVERFLRQVGVEDNLIKQVIHCVYCSDRKNLDEAKTIEAKVVYDADKLQVVGPFGIMRELAHCMESKYNWKFRKSIEYTRKAEPKYFKTLQTKTARRLAKKPHDYLTKFWKLFDGWDSGGSEVFK